MSSAIMKRGLTLLGLGSILFVSSLQAYVTPTFTGVMLSGDVGNSYSAAVGDFNNDGLKDIYVVNTNQQNKIRLQLAQGGFTGAQISGDIGTSRGAAVGDFNNDGLDDIYVTSEGSQSNKLRLQLAQGGFTGALISGDGGYSILPKVGDFNNDGLDDIYVAKYGAQNKIRLQLAQGGFTGADINGDIYDTISATVGDFNNDGLDDIYVANYGQQNKLRLQLAQGGFTGADIQGDLGVSRGAIAGDFNNDGLDDIYVANSHQQNKLRLQLAQGGFTGADIQGDLGQSISVVAGDFNQDGLDDIYVGNYDEQNKLRIQLSGGGFTGVVIAIESLSTYEVLVSDFNQDGFDDVYEVVFGQQNKLRINTTDLISPSVNLLGVSSITIDQGATYNDSGAVRSDNVDGTGVLLVATSGSVNTQVVGEYILYYYYTDQAGNISNTSMRTVTVRAVVVAPTPPQGGGGGSKSSNIYYTPTPLAVEPSTPTNTPIAIFAQDDNDQPSINPTIDGESTTVVTSKISLNPSIIDGYCYTRLDDVAIVPSTTVVVNTEFESVLEFMNSYEMTHFTSVDEYMPYVNLTRGQAAKFFVQFATRILCKTPTSEQPRYVDINEGDPSLQSYIVAAYQLGLMKGGPDNKFRSRDKISKAEFNAVLVRMMVGSYLPEDGDQWYDRYNQVSTELGIINQGAGQQAILRHDAALMLHRAYLNQTYELQGDHYMISNRENYIP